MLAKGLDCFILLKKGGIITFIYIYIHKRLPTYGSCDVSILFHGEESVKWKAFIGAWNDSIGYGWYYRFALVSFHERGN